MDDYLNNPNVERVTACLLSAAERPPNVSKQLAKEEQNAAQRLLFVERCTSFPFSVRLDTVYKLTRTQLPLTHACVRTCQSSQGLTFKGGVIVDMSKMKRIDSESWWLNVCVMLSRGVALEIAYCE